MICRHCRVEIHLDGDGPNWSDGMYIACLGDFAGPLMYHQPDISDEEAIAGLQDIVRDL